MGVKMKVEFDPEIHQYKIDGVIVPSVTQILGQDSEVFKYAARKKGLPDNYYADRGTEIHRITQVYDETGNAEQFKDHEWYGYLKAWIKFRTENEIEIYGREMIVASKELMLAGILDVLCEMYHYKWLLDIKSGSRTPTHKIQVSGYKLLYEQDTRNRAKRIPEKLGCVYIRKNGNYSFEEYKYDPYEVEYLRAKYER